MQNKSKSRKYTSVHDETELVTSMPPPSQKVTDVLLIKLDSCPDIQYRMMPATTEVCPGFIEAFEAKKRCFVVFESKDTAMHAQ
ncbi:hypothetical protein HDU81_006358 [Chytriomyces hyalinus]|nr:hypothetical protein HDU81_006358 [Chytriomyces hyalinus]